MFYRLNVQVMLIALNECAVHLYVIVIEKKESCDSFKSFALLSDVLWQDEVISLGSVYDLCNTVKQKLRLILFSLTKRTKNSFHFFNVLITKIAN